MKLSIKIISTLIVILLFDTMFAANRISWWETRVQNLRNEQDALKKSDYYPYISEALTQDIDRTNELIQFIEDELSGVSNHAKHYGDDYLKGAIGKALTGAFAFTYTNYMLEQLNDTLLLQKGKSLLISSSYQTVNNHFPGSTKKEADKVSAGIITSPQIKAFSHEVLLQELLALEEKRREEFLSKYIPQMITEFSDERTPLTQIEKIALEMAETEYEKWKQDELFIDNTYVTSSLVWKDLRFSIEEKCGKMSHAESILNSNGLDSSILQSLYYVEKPYLLENKLFNNPHPHDTNRTSLIKETINLARKNTQKKTGREYSIEEFSEALDVYNQTVQDSILKYTPNTVEKKVVDDYSTTTKGYLTFLHMLNRTHPGIIEENIRYRLERSAQYGLKIEKLYKSIFQLSHRTINTRENELVSSTKLIKNELRFLGWGATLLPSYRNLLPKEKVSVLLEEKKSVNGRISNNAVHIDHFYSAYKNYSNDFKKKMLEKQNEASSEIASMELAVLSQSVLDYYNHWEKLNFNKDFLSNYSYLFEKYYKELKEGRQPDQIETIVVEKSLLTLLGEGEAEKMTHERKAKEYLELSLKRDIIRFNKLAEYYRSRGVDPAIMPSTKPLYKAQHETEKRSNTKIASWTMTETNVEDIDRKAALMLATLYRKNRWEGRNTSGTVKTSESQTVVLKNTKISLTIPDGWNKQTKDSTVAFVSEYDNSAFTVSVLQDVSEKEAVDNYLNEHRMTKVQLGWDEYGERLYFWNIAKDENGTVSKIYAYSHNGAVIIFTGSVKKERYHFFHNRIDTVFKSIKH
jgi:hypothetical protein